MSYRKPVPDLYTVLLVIALVAVLIAILFLCLEMGLYDFQVGGGPSVVMSRELGTEVWGQMMVAAGPRSMLDDVLSPLTPTEHGCSKIS